MYIAVCENTGDGGDGIGKKADVEKNQEGGKNASCMAEWNHLTKTYRRKRDQAHVIGIEPRYMLNKLVAKGSQQHGKYHQTHGIPKSPNGIAYVLQATLLGK